MHLVYGWLFLITRGVNEALELTEKVSEESGFEDFVPISSEIYRLGPSRISSAEDRELALERYFNSKKLTSFSQIIEEFNSYHLPCLEDKNKLICEYYAIYSRGRRELYTVISLSFELLDNQLKVGYDDQSCEVYYDAANRVRNFTQRAIALQKRFSYDRSSQIKSAKKT